MIETVCVILFESLKNQIHEQIGLIDTGNEELIPLLVPKSIGLWLLTLILSAYELYSERYKGVECQSIYFK
jgi:hypothetical protein